MLCGDVVFPVKTLLAYETGIAPALSDAEFLAVRIDQILTKL